MSMINILPSQPAPHRGLHSWLAGEQMISLSFELDIIVRDIIVSDIIVSDIIVSDMLWTKYHCARYALSQILLCYYSEEIIGDIPGMPRAQASNSSHRTHLNR